MIAVTDGYWWWRASKNAKWKIVHVTDGGTAIRRVGYADPIPVSGEFGQKIVMPALPR